MRGTPPKGGCTAGGAKPLERQNPGGHRRSGRLTPGSIGTDSEREQTPEADPPVTSLSGHGGGGALLQRARGENGKRGEGAERRSGSHGREGPEGEIPGAELG